MAVALSTFFAGMQTASADDVVIKRIGSHKSLWVTTDYRDYDNERHIVSIIGYFANHRPRSVKLTKFKICYSNSGNHPSVSIAPEVHDPGQWSKGWRYRVFGDGTCRTWSVNRTFTKPARGQMIQIVAKVSGTAPKGLQIVGFNR